MAAEDVVRALSDALFRVARMTIDFPDDFDELPYSFEVGCGSEGGVARRRLPAEERRLIGVDGVVSDGIIRIVVGDLYGHGVPRGRWSDTSEIDGLVAGVVAVPGTDSVEFAVAIQTPRTPRLSARTTVEVEYTATQWDGRRAWFRCPACDRRIAHLFVYDVSVSCSTCLGLRHESTLLQPRDRLYGRCMKIRKRLQAEMTLGAAIVRRPKGMHRPTFGRLCDELEELEAALLASDDVRQFDLASEVEASAVSARGAAGESAAEPTLPDVLQAVRAAVGLTSGDGR
jgi:hypothetical protein